MTDDLVKRLRESDVDGLYGLRSIDWMREAADRIEKLEAALKKIALDDPDCCMIADRMRETAEIALGLKND